MDVFDKNCSGLCAITLPEFSAMHGVRNHEKQGVSNCRQIPRPRVTGSRINVLDKNCSSLCTITLPEFNAMDRITSSKK